MQVVCANCQLNFDAPDGATGLVCPICRNPLLPEGGEGADKTPGSGPTRPVLDWNGGSLDDLIALLAGPAASARVEVLPSTGDVPAGEVHLMAGGVADALFGGQSTDEALDKLRAVSHARFRIEARLPDPANGSLSVAGPESGTLDGRPLAHLMRYCEDYVITCAIDVWRGNETARVEYKRGEISGVTVGGIDAPERLAEVMKWASGNYRLVVPPISIPAIAPKRAPVPSAAAAPAAPAPPAPVPAPAASAQAAARQASATKTIFGIPAAEVAAARAAAAKAAAAAAPPAPAAAAPAAPPPSAPMTPPGVAPSSVPSPFPASRAGASATRTMFGVPAPDVPARGGAAAKATPEPPARAAEPGAPTAPASTSDSGRTERKTGARKVAVPAPAIAAPPASAAPSPSPPPAMAAAAPETPAEAPDAIRTTQSGYDAPRAAQAPARKAPAAGDKTAPMRAPSSAPRPRETSIWTYVGVGFTFGLALLGIYQLVGRLAH